MPSSDLRVRVLGELAIERDGVAMAAPAGRPARSLLGALALDHRPHARSALAARLWPDVLDDSARASLRGALAALRRALEPGAEDVLIATRDHVGLSDAVWVDTEAFEAHVVAGRFADAVGLWRGDLLLGLDGDDVLAARDAWRERMAEALRGLADAADAAGDPAAAIAHTRRIVALDPLAEAGQRALIGRLADGGDRAAALAAYRRYADRLRAELQIAPSAATRALLDTLRAEDDTRVGHGSSAAPQPVGHRADLPAPFRRDDDALIGRADELARLAAAWHTAKSGQLCVVSVAGNAGIGKTRLIAELCRLVHAEGATVMLGRSHEETLTPYEPFVEALRGHVTAFPADARERGALFEAIVTVLCRAADERPVVLVLDDVHWADEASLLLLRYIAREATDARVLILISYRDTEIHEDDTLAAALAQLRRARTLTTVALKGLDAAGVAALVRRRGSDLPDAAVSAVAEQTEGNPFFVEEVLRDARPDGTIIVPDSITDLLRRRLRALGEPARQTLSAAAVLGREFDLSELEAVAHGPADVVLDAIDAALTEHVLVDVAATIGRYAFAHALIRETVYDQISPVRRPELHLRAGEAIEARHAAELDEHAAQLAMHFARAGADARSLDHQLRAALWAAGRHAPEVAIAHFSTALETAERLGLTADADARLRRALLERGWLHWLAGERELAVSDIHAAIAAARMADDGRLEAQALDSLAYAEQWFDVDSANVHQAEALAIAVGLGDAPQQVRILSRTALVRANALDFVGARAAGEQALQIAVATGEDHDRALALDALKLAALQLGELDRLEELTKDLEEIQRRDGDHWYLQWTLLEAAFVPLARAEWTVAETKLHEVLALNDRVGDSLTRPVIHDAACWLDRSRGRLAQALVAGNRAVELARRQTTGFEGWAAATLGWALLDLRDADTAVGVLERGLAAAGMISVRYRAAGHLAWAQTLVGADAQDAIGVAESAAAALRVADGGAVVYGFGAAASLARAQLAAGRPERGAAIVAPLRDAAARSGWHEATARLALVHGLCREAAGDDDGARTDLDTSWQLADRHGFPGTAWEACAALARLSPARAAAALRRRSAALVDALTDGVDHSGLR